MQDIVVKIQEQFGEDELPHGLFYCFDQALRFELGGEEFGIDRPMRRFLQAHGRSEAIAQTFFENSSEIHVLLSSYGTEQPKKKRFRPFKRCGIKRSRFKHFSKTPQHDDWHIAEFGSDRFRHWDIAKLEDKKTVSEIIWLAIASEMAVEPKLDGSSSAYLLDVSRGLLLHVYDDRGMDIVASEAAPLRELFRKFKPWLLEHDLPSMSAKFGGDNEEI
jgi:hypothetical protein